ncbi:restriction endonuclease subunit S domain-containing protein [Nocardia fluminea]|uniref:Type I restriction enzyme S subunit n=1 Tax=Nocardia fluminea TaxID=134984 RepID=A0A2N3WYL5_9NOCA|nr:restriction endonuclease subunit S [Nocardia fluminea]PKV98973.1 type I restriction enzyme S subunit [Nocardia fluminea]
MAEERTTSTFQDLLDRGVLEIGDGYRAKNSELGGSGHVFMRAGRLSSQGWDWEGADRFHTYLEEKIKGKMSCPGDTVITTKGNSTGRTGYVSEEMQSFVYSPHLSYWRSRDVMQLDARYLRYWALSPEFIGQLKSMAHGTDMAPYLSLGDQKRLNATLPGISEQRAIGAALGALDDKIAVNERIAATTLGLARALFQQSNLSTESAVPMGDLIELKYGKSLPATRRIAGDYSVFGSGGVSGTHNEFLVKGPGIIVGRKGTVGSVYWSEESFFPIDTTFYAVCRDGNVSLEYAYFALQSLGLEHMNSDSAVPGLNRDRAYSAPMTIPSPEAVRKFTSEARALFALQRSREQESHTLAILRDTLLPHLMSGRLRVKDVEKIIEDHA